jgi:hypothetical protein
MVALSLPGFYEDDAGRVDVTWEVSTRAYTSHGHERLEVHGDVRGEHLWGTRLENVEPADYPRSHSAGVVTTIRVRSGGTVAFAPLRHEVDTRTTVTLDLAGAGYHGDGGDLEEAMRRLAATLPPQVRLECCLTCRWSDYDPTGHESWDLRCHREQKVEFLSVRSKHDRWAVSVTEDVPEFYWCAEYQEASAGGVSAG